MKEIVLTPKQVEKVIEEYANFLDAAKNYDSQNMATIFLLKLPLSCLPYPKQVIKHALDALEKSNPDSEELARNIAVTRTHLDLYVPDDEAFDALNDNLNDRTTLKSIKDSLSLRQEDNFNDLLKNS